VSEVKGPCEGYFVGQVSSVPHRGFRAVPFGYFKVTVKSIETSTEPFVPLRVLPIRTNP
jgi:hypothetical protein